MNTGAEQPKPTDEQQIRDLTLHIPILYVLSNVKEMANWSEVEYLRSCVWALVQERDEYRNRLLDIIERSVVCCK